MEVPHVDRLELFGNLIKINPVVAMVNISETYRT
jgi:hypothetical protein